MKSKGILTLGLAGLIMGCYDEAPYLHDMSQDEPTRVRFADDFGNDEKPTPKDIPTDTNEYCNPENALVKPIIGETYRTGCVGVQNMLIQRPDEYTGIGVLFYTRECLNEPVFFHRVFMEEVYLDDEPVFIEYGLRNRTPCEPEQDSPDDYFWFTMHPERNNDYEINQSMITFDLYLVTEEERDENIFVSEPFKGQVYCQDKDSCNGMIIR